MTEATSNYDTRLMQIWENSAAKPVVISPITREQAVSLRHKLYRLRAQLRKDKHALAEIANQSMITIYPKPAAQPPANWELTVHSNVSGIEQALVNAGITAGDPPELD